MYNLIATRAELATDIDGTNNTGPTAGIYTGSGGDMVVVMAQDGQRKQFTLVGTAPGTVIPIAIRHYVSGPADALALIL